MDTRKCSPSKSKFSMVQGIIVLLAYILWNKILNSQILNKQNRFKNLFYLPQTIFLAPDGKGPVSLNLSTMGKGQAWVNGQSIGRYWPAYLSPSTGCTDHCDYRGTYDPFKCLKKCGQAAQTL